MVNLTGELPTRDDSKTEKQIQSIDEMVDVHMLIEGASHRILKTAFEQNDEAEI
jgi:hypothetical protein